MGHPVLGTRDKYLLKGYRGGYTLKKGEEFKAPQSRPDL